MCCKLRRSVVAGMKMPLDTFPYLPLGEPHAYLRGAPMDVLEWDWDLKQVRPLCTPVYLIIATVLKLEQTRASTLLLVPAWT